MTLPKKFWDFIPFQPIPTLDALRNAVLERTTKRMPKWKFKLADPPLFPKIVMTLQPKVLLKTFGLPGFQGDAKMHYSEELHCDIIFRLLIADQWRFKPWACIGRAMHRSPTATKKSTRPATACSRCW